MRATLHFIVTMLGAFFGAIALCFCTVVCALAMLGKRIDPTHKRGNCWTYALPEFVEKGGYLAVRASDGLKFLGVFIVPHVLYMPILHGRSVISQYSPTDRLSSFWCPWFVLHYKGRVRHVESNHNADDCQ